MLMFGNHMNDHQSIQFDSYKWNILFVIIHFTAGKYSCIAKNCMGEAQSSAELTIEDIKAHLNDEEKEQLLATNIPPR